MKGILTIFRRELGAYFSGPLGYVYLIAFLLFTNLLGLFSPINPFFFYPVADMRTYFHVLAGVSTIFMTAVTMRLWAEERKENTYEMLLTFPMASWKLVLGKFFASMGFYLIALLGTLPVPLMIALVSQSDDAAATAGAFGMLDMGPVLSGYLGVFLAGALFVSFGLFVSGFCRDQIVAFVLTAPVLFVAYLLGLPIVKTLIDSALSFLGEGWGARIGDFIGVFAHFDNLTRGVINGSDLVFFLIWITVFLLLNGMGVERRGRIGANVMYAASCVLLIGIGVAGNWVLMERTIGRWDVTEDQIYTVSPAAVKVFSQLDDDVVVKYYVSRQDKLPREMQSIERDVRDKLETLSLASGGRLRYKIFSGLEASNAFVDPMEEEKSETDEEKDTSIEQRLLKKIQPFQAQVAREDEVTTQLVYSAMEIAYKDKESEVIPQIVPSLLPKLEYLLTNKVYRLTRDKAPVVALVAPETELNIPPQLEAIYRQMGREIPRTEDPYKTLKRYLESEKYEVRRVKLTKDSPLPDNYDVLVVLNPKNFNARQQWEVNRAMRAGKPTFLAAQKYSWDYQMLSGRRRGAASITRKDESPNVNTILKASGLRVDTDVLMDTQTVPLNIGMGGMLGMSQPWKLPMQVMVTPATMNTESPLTRKLNSLFYLWGTALELNEELLKSRGIKPTILFRSSADSWARATGENLMNDDIKEPSDRSVRHSRPLCVLLEGQFEDAFAGQERPAWPTPPSMTGQPEPPADDEAPAKPLTPAQGKMIVMGCAYPFQNNFLEGDAASFFLNCVDYLALGDTGMQILSLRDKTARARVIGKLDKEKDHVTLWKFIHTLGLVMVITAAGFAVWMVRDKRRNAYRAQF